MQYYTVLTWFVLSAFLESAVVSSQSVINNAAIDGNELRCLVCKASIHELSQAISKIDPTKTVDVGGHRLDADGNYKGKEKIPQIKSELHLSEMIEDVCNVMDDYVRGFWKSNDTLTIFKMIENGKMSPHMGAVNIVQDEDLNKSLKYICEGIMSEHEEPLIKYYQNEERNIEKKFCELDSEICAYTPVQKTNEEL